MGDGGGKAAMDVREVALPTQMSMRQAGSSYVEHIVRLGETLKWVLRLGIRLSG